MNKYINATLGCIVLMSILFMSQRAWSSDMDEVGCLAEAIYFEARGEDIVGMILYVVSFMPVTTTRTILLGIDVSFLTGVMVSMSDTETSKHSRW